MSRSPRLYPKPTRPNRGQGPAITTRTGRAARKALLRVASLSGGMTPREQVAALHAALASVGLQVAPVVKAPPVVTPRGPNRPGAGRPPLSTTPSHSDSPRVKMPGVEVARCPGVSIRWNGVLRTLSFIPDMAWRVARGDEHVRVDDVYDIEGDLASDTLIAVTAIQRRDGPAGLSAWLQSVWSESVTEPATGAYQADAGGWYRSAGRMVQRASYGP